MLDADQAICSDRHPLSTLPSHAASPLATYSAPPVRISHSSRVEKRANRPHIGTILLRFLIPSFSSLFGHLHHRVTFRFIEGPRIYTKRSLIRQSRKASSGPRFFRIETSTNVPTANHRKKKETGSINQATETAMGNPQQQVYRQPQYNSSGQQSSYGRPSSMSSSMSKVDPEDLYVRQERIGE